MSLSYETITRITLKNQNSMQVTLANYGARILSIVVPNKNNDLVETTLNYDDDAKIIKDDAYMGATCGRVSNRIGGAKYKHNDQEVVLNSNEGHNMLHGGAVGFSHRFWSLSEHDADKNSVTFTLLSEHGDQGFPGNLHASVTYTLTEQNTLVINYEAKCDRVCPINMCNHAYFNLGEDSIHELELLVNADTYTPIDNNSLPTGEFAQTTGIFDFKETQKLAKKLKVRDFDECFVVNQSHNARLLSRNNGIMLDIYSDQLGLQVYTGNFLPVKYSGIALEAQGLIDAVNQEAFEEHWVGPDQNYTKTIKYVFSSF